MPMRSAPGSKQIQERTPMCIIAFQQADEVVACGVYNRIYLPK
jgi:hypothetical protein